MIEKNDVCATQSTEFRVDAGAKAVEQIKH